MRRNKFAAIFSGLLAGGIFILFHFLLNIGLVISLVIGIVGYIVGLMIFQEKESNIEYVANGVTQYQVNEIILQGKKQVLRIRGLNRKIAKDHVKKDVNNICNTADAIFEDFKKDPKDVKVARKFLNYYLDTTEKILDKYVELNGLHTKSSEVEASMKKVEEVLDLIDATFKEQLNKLLENDILDLDVEVDLLKRIIKSEGV